MAALGPGLALTGPADKAAAEGIVTTPLRKTVSFATPQTAVIVNAAADTPAHPGLRRLSKAYSLVRFSNGRKSNPVALYAGLTNVLGRAGGTAATASERMLDLRIGEESLTISRRRKSGCYLSAPRCTVHPGGPL